MSAEGQIIPDDMAQRVARLINEAEDMRAQAVDDLKTIYGDLREELKSLGWLGQNISKEVAALKGAIAEIRLDDEKKAKRDEKGDRVEDYVSIISKARARAPARTRENIEQFDPLTGEFLDDNVDPKLAHTIVSGLQTEIGRAALTTAIDIIIAREEAEEDRVANVGEGATSTTAAASSDPASRTDDESERQHSSTVGFADDCRTGGKEQSDASAAPVGDAAAYAHRIPALSEIVNEGGATETILEAGQGAGNSHLIEPTGPVAERATSLTAKPPSPLRPHCRNPGETCGGSGSKHCHACTKAMREQEEFA